MNGYVSGRNRMVPKHMCKSRETIPLTLHFFSTKLVSLIIYSNAVHIQ
jgi:hypothetical protein